MPIKSNMDGLKKLEKNARELDGKHQVKLADLMSPDFITSCSNFKDLDHLFSESGFVVESKEDFEAIPDAEWEEFIVRNTSFDSWEEMQKAAGAEYVKKQLLKGL
ncbi:hypothetical protein IHC93_17600 [Photobacterium damselae subsp. damselae]|uniref:hypothetical protein n=1 Tax=Photobacterium damselae TaxID=38293 RepID=UPI001F30A3DE|nr:hypothetical protein [Photobacterium damselae]UKA27827.1 hypothetical protein IHC93_17600 [Photobacterium damselae subsp. damselae]